MIESRCGLVCSKCEFKDNVCRGCTISIKPFWGDSCPVKACCEVKKLEHCGLCQDFPCELLKEFAFDEKHGDNGERIKQCQKWKSES